MKSRYFFMTVVFFAAAVLFLYAQQEPEHSMTVKELKEAIKKDSTLIVLDVRTPGELVSDLGKIDNVINIPVQELEARLDELKKHKKNKIAVVCRSGRRSAVATGILQKNGYKAVNVSGGMLAWREAGF